MNLLFIDTDFLKTISVLFLGCDKNITNDLIHGLKDKIGDIYLCDDYQKLIKDYQKYQPDLLIIDSSMAENHDLEGIEALKKLKDTVSTIIITDTDNDNFLLKAMSIGIDTFIPRSIDLDGLLIAICKNVSHLFHKKEDPAIEKDIHLILDMSPDFMIISDGDKIDFINHSFLQFLGYNCLDSFRKEHNDLSPFISNINDIPYYNGDLSWLKKVLKEPDKEHIVQFYNPEENEKYFCKYWIHHKLFPGCKKHILSFVEQIQKKPDLSTLNTDGTKDSLTGLDNRLKFAHSLFREIKKAKRCKTPLSLILLDLYLSDKDTDNKEITESDLKEIADIITANTYKCDVISRIGESRLGILVPDTILEDAKTMAIRLRKLLASQEKIHKAFGLSQLKMDDTIGSFLKRTDEAIQRAKYENSSGIELESPNYPFP